MDLTRPARFIARAGPPQGLPVLRPLLGMGLARVFGPPPFAPDAYPGDPGLFGPGSASWRVLAEPASIVGGVRALLVQLLHPLAMAGVAEHSRFREDALGRLQRTSSYVVGTTFGAIPEVFALARVVRGAHRSVVGIGPGGRAYRASDPHLLTWVSLALTSSFLAADRAFAPRPVDRDVADAFVAEQSRACALLDERVDLETLARDPDRVEALRRGQLPLPMVDDGMLPRDVVGMERALRAYRSELSVDAQGREALRFLLWPSLEPILRAAYLPLLGGAIATLDGDMRALLGVRVPRGAPALLSAQAANLLSVMRLVTGRSPSEQAALRRARASAQEPSASMYAENAVGKI